MYHQRSNYKNRLEFPFKQGVQGSSRTFFHFFHSFFDKIFSLQITIIPPMAFMHLAKVAQNWHNTSDQLGIWAMSCGPVPNSEIWAGR